MPDLNWNPQDAPDENFKQLLKAVKECPATEEELRVKSELEQERRDRLVTQLKSENAQLRLQIANVTFLQKRNGGVGKNSHGLISNSDATRWLDPFFIWILR